MGIFRPYLPPQSLKPLLLRLGIDPGADDKGEDVEERHPGLLGQELLRKGQRQGRDDPADLHDGHEASSDGRSDLVEGPGPGDDGHGGEVDGVLDGCNLHIRPMSARLGVPDPAKLGGWWHTYDQIADENLHNLRRQARPPGEHPLQYADQEVAQRRADEGAVHCHLGHAGVDVMAGRTDIFRDPRGQDFLQS